MWEGCEKYAKKKTGLSRMRGRLLARMEALLEARRTSTLGAGKMGRGPLCEGRGVGDEGDAIEGGAEDLGVGRGEGGEDPVNGGLELGQKGEAGLVGLRTG